MSSMTTGLSVPSLVRKNNALEPFNVVPSTVLPLLLCSHKVVTDHDNPTQIDSYFSRPATMEIRGLIHQPFRRIACEERQVQDDTIR